MRKLGKKGSAQDILLMGIILITLSVVILIVYKVQFELNGGINAHPGIPDTAKTASNQVTNLFPGVIDSGFLFLVVGLAIVAFILAALVRVHPIFLVFYFIVLVMIIFFCGIFSNLYQEIAANPEFTALADDLIFTSHIMNYLPFIVGIFGSILAIVMYKIWNVQ